MRSRSRSNQPLSYGRELELYSTATTVGKSSGAGRASTKVEAQLRSLGGENDSQERILGDGREGEGEGERGIRKTVETRVCEEGEGDGLGRGG